VRELKDRESMVLQGEHRRKDGSSFPVEINVKYISVGGKDYMVAVARDITERKRAEDALRRSEAGLLEAQRLAQLGSWELDLKTNRLQWSDEIYRIFEMDRERFGATYEAFLEAVHPEDRDMVGKAYSDSLKTRTPYEIDHRLLMKDGRIKFVHEQCETHYDEAGAPVRSLGTVQDITERRLSEEELRKRDEFILNILETVDEGFIVIDPDYRIIAANKAYCEQVKMPSADIIGKHCHEVSHHLGKPCFLEGEECAPAHTFKTGGPYAAIHTHFDSSGNPVYVETKSYPIKDASGKVTAVIETLNDMSEKRRLEEQLRHAQKMEAIGTLAGGIAHDFNNMLNVILGYCGLMQMEMKETDPLLPYVREMLRAGDRASDLTKGLLIFSRKKTLELQPVDVNVIIEGFRKMIGRIIGEDIELRITASDEPLILMADRGHLEQVLMNLAANARDAMPEGGILGIEIKRELLDSSFIKVHGYGEPGEYAVISATDTGTGMDARTRERIFEPYFTTKGIGRGTGLGLSIVFGIVRQHRGYINCYSELGRGTTFKIYLPLVKIEGAETIEEKAAAPKRGTETLLVAEDDPAVRDLTKITLENYGYTVIEAVDGEDAVNKFRENQDNIHIVVLDVIMPRKNGRDAYEDIKGIRHDIRAIFMSGYDADIIKTKGILEDGMAFVSKPVSPLELLTKVREGLDK